MTTTTHTTEPEDAQTNKGKQQEQVEATSSAGVNTQLEKAENGVPDSFQYQLDMLKTEVEIIDRAIARLDEITQTTKNWSVLIWSGSIAVFLGQPDLRPFVIFTAVIPLLFWIIDARWRYFLISFIFRQDKIADFVNSDQLFASFNKRRLVGIKILDPRGSQHRQTEEYKRRVNIWRSMRYPEVYVMYIGMMLLSVMTGLFFMV